MKNTALILIDIQNDYFPGGQLPLENPEEAAAKASALLNLFRQHDWTRIHVQHIMSPERNLPFFLKDTCGVTIHESVAPADGEMLIEKHFPSAFTGTDLDQYLKIHGIHHLILCGMMSHMCVSATARVAMEHGYQVTIPDDATTTRSLTFEGIEIPAETVRNANFAALHGTVAEICGTDCVLQRIKRTTPQA